MNAIVQATKSWCDDAVRGWDRFWFTPARPETLALIRILGGAMLFYTHFVWGLKLNAFLGPQAFVDNATALQLQDGWYSWSYLWYIESPVLLWTLHIAALGVFALFTLGLFTRFVSVLAVMVGTLVRLPRSTGRKVGTTSGQYGPYA